MIREIYVVTIFITCFGAQAGLLDDYQHQSEAEGKATARQNAADRRAFVDGVVQGWLLRKLELPADTRVVNEGFSREASGADYNVGGQWGCYVPFDTRRPNAITCLSASGQWKRFPFGPVIAAEDIWYCRNYPHANPGACARLRK